MVGVWDGQTLVFFLHFKYTKLERRGRRGSRNFYKLLIPTTTLLDHCPHQSTGLHYYFFCTQIERHTNRKPVGREQEHVS